MAGAENLHGVQLVFLLLLLTVTLFAALARRLSVPYPILLVIAGLAIGFVPHVPRVSLNPDLVFLILLPPLLYASAWQMSWRVFRHNLVPISMLALGLVAFTVWGVAEVADRFITALDWKSGFILGAVVATTDAIAATSIARSLGLPQGMVDVLEGESLVNDATGLLALELGLAMLQRGSTPGAGAGLLRLLWLAGGGLGVGLLLASVTAWAERLVDDGPLEMAISLLVPYAAYEAGEQIHASGVLAVVACGLALSGKSGELFSPAARLQLIGTWEALNFILNGLVFVLIGLQLPYVLAGIRDYSRWTLLEYGAIFSFVLIVLRLFWMFPATWLSYWIRTRVTKQAVARPDARQIFVVGWTGMRGVVALAAAISLPETLSTGQPFERRNLLIFLTFSVILVTLVLQGLTLPALIRLLGLAGDKEGEARAEAEARQVLLGEAIAFLEQSAHGESAGDLLHFYRIRLAAYNGEDRERYREGQRLARETRSVERGALMRLRDEGRIGDEMVRRLERELDLTDTRQVERL